MNVLSDMHMELINSMKTFCCCFLETNIAFRSVIYYYGTKGEKTKSQGWIFSGGKDRSFRSGLVLLLGGGKHETHPSPARSLLRFANQANLVMAIHQNRGKRLLSFGLFTYVARKADQFGWDPLQFGLITPTTDAETCMLRLSAEDTEDTALQSSAVTH